MPFVRGIPLWPFFKAMTPEGLEETQKRIARQVIANLFRQGFAHTDLHDGNLIVSSMNYDPTFDCHIPQVITAIDFGIGYFVNINEDLSNHVYEVIYHNLRYLYNRQENSIWRLKTSKEIAVMMYSEIKNGCPECNIPQSRGVPGKIVRIRKHQNGRNLRDWD